MKRTVALVSASLMASVIGVFATGGSAQAYCTNARKWSTPTVAVRPSSSVPTGWDSILSASTAQWRGISGSTFAINPVGRAVSGPIRGGGFYLSRPSSGFPGGAPGVTITTASGNSLTSANVYFDPTFTWNTAGTMNQSQKRTDVRTVLVHELGHWLTLNHPSQCGASMTSAEIAASMNPNWQKKWNTNSDDKAGAAAMY